MRLSRIRGDVVHFEWLSVALRWAGLFDALGDRIVVSCHGAEITAYPHMPRWARKASGLPDLFSRASAVHCVSADVAAEGVRYGLDPETSVVIRTAVDLDFFHPPAPSPAPRHGYTLVAVGQLRWLKGYEYIVVTLAELVRAGIPATLDLVGGGLSPDAARENEYDRILQAISDFGLEEHVRLHGEIAPALVRERLYASDVLVHLSLAEGLPTVILEAMACGVPVVATDVGGTREAVTDGVEGFLVPPREPGAAAAALERLWRDPGLRAQMGAAGRARVGADFGSDAEAARFLALYERVALERRRALDRTLASGSKR